MKKFTILLIALIAGSFAMQMNAQPSKGPARSDNYSTKPSAYEQLGNTSIYWDIAERYANGPGYQYGVSILGKIGNLYYSSTFEREVDNTWWWETDEPNPGAGFIAALQVNNGTPKYVNALDGTTLDDVIMTTRLEPQGEVAARIVYTLTNTSGQAVTVNAGVWGDIMIGDNDKAPLELLKTSAGAEYGIKMKHDNNSENPPLLCVLFGEGVTGVTPIDDYWFGFFSTNWHANEIVGQYSRTVYNTVNVNGQTNNWPSSNSQYYLVENGTYDSGLGFCWKEREIQAGESIELSYLISVGEIDFEEPIIPDPEPGEDIFTYNIEAFDCDAWNDLSADHPIHVWGHYEHPYGQAGYLEYQVDDENGWHSMGELTSGEDYEFNFNISFNENRTTDHVIAVRFNDGLDNYTELDGLSWIDVRSFEATGTDAVYNGMPQTFVVTINGETFTYETDYVVPGEYNVGTYEGAFEDNTIGVKDIIVNIDKAPCQYEVILPFEKIEYDGEAHGATVIVPEGSGEVTIIYENAITGERTTEAPVEPGLYDVYIIITEGEYYYGIDETNVGQFEITAPETAVEELSTSTMDNGAWYTIDGRRVAAPTNGVYIHNGKKYVIVK